MTAISPMIYSTIKSREEYGTYVLCEDEYKGYSFYIINLWTHPCAYVKLRAGNKFFNKEWDELEEINCHGGVTYARDYLTCSKIVKNTNPNTSLYKAYYRENIVEVVPKSDRCWVIGWDYAHSGDKYSDSKVQGKMWSTEEIIEECKEVIDQIIKLNSVWE